MSDRESHVPAPWREDEAELLDRASHGVLALNRAGHPPLLRPLNFVRVGSHLYAHGALEGEKMEALAHDGAASFLVVEDYSLVPSYFIHPQNACPATQYYRALLAEGKLREVEDPHEKARALQALMAKLQPEGGHEVIEADTERYAKAIRTTAVLRLEVERVSSKFNFGQDARGAKRRGIEAGLEERATEIDRRTLECMRGSARGREILEGPREADPQDTSEENGR
jgi:hypothetical protein